MQQPDITETVRNSRYPNSLLKRVFDISVVIASIIIVAPIFFISALCIKVSSPGPIFFLSDRIGRDNAVFVMLKFRTMRVGTPVVATDKLASPEEWITPFGRFLRRTSLDELPQLINVLLGDMSLVGPRPALFNQDELIRQRTYWGVHRLVPGITGLAQISGRDELDTERKVAVDVEYLKAASLVGDLSVILATAGQIFAQHGIRH